MKDLNITVYHGDTFWPNYFLDLICAIILIAVSIIFILLWKQDRSERKNLYISAFAFFVFIIASISLVIPKSLDIKHLENPIVMDGIFNHVSVENSKNTDNLPGETILKINNKNFTLRGNHPELKQFVGERVTIHYLPKSNYVLKVDLSFKKRGNE